MRLRLTLMLISTLLSGCAGLAPTAPDARYFRGWVRPLGDHYLFQECRQQAWTPLAQVAEPVAQEYRRQRSQAPGLPLYVESWGRNTSHGVALMEPRVIGGELDSCDQVFNGARLHLRGESPDWVAELGQDQVRFSDQAGLKTQLFKSPDLLREGHLWRWRAQMRGVRNQVSRVALEIDPVPCRDAAGHWYRLSARVVLDGAEYAGCARYGNLARIGLAERYSSDAERYLRQLSIELQAEGQATLLDDYRNGQPAFVRSGRWERLGDGGLLLNLTTEDGRGEKPLLWRQQGDGSLRLETPHPSYGAGVLLRPAGERLQWSPEYRARLP